MGPPAIRSEGPSNWYPSGDAAPRLRRLGPGGPLAAFVGRFGDSGDDMGLLGDEATTWTSHR